MPLNVKQTRIYMFLQIFGGNCYTTANILLRNQQPASTSLTETVEAGQP